MPLRSPGPTTISVPPRYRSPTAWYSCTSCGTTDETMAASTSSSVSPRRCSRPTSTVASSSAVDSRTVAKRQCSTSASPRNMPMCVWVLPTSTASSIAARLSLVYLQGAELAHSLVHQPGQHIREPRAIRQHQVGVQLEQRLEHEAPRPDLRMRQAEAVRGVLEPIEQQQVDVDLARRVPHSAGLAPQLALHRLALGEQVLRLEVRLDGDARVEEVRLLEDLALR